MSGQVERINLVGGGHFTGPGTASQEPELVQAPGQGQAAHTEKAVAGAATAHARNEPTGGGGTFDPGARLEPTDGPRREVQNTQPVKRECDFRRNEREDREELSGRLEGLF